MTYPRLLALATAEPSYDYPQRTILACAQNQILGPQWQSDPQARERMATSREAAHTLGRVGMEAALGGAQGIRAAGDVTDFVVVSCTGSSAPGLDITVAPDLGGLA